MPEGPELHIAARFVNQICNNRTFSGAVIKSEVSTKNPDVAWNEQCYQISATSRGKEVKLMLTTDCDVKSDKSKGKPVKIMDILFRFGMSGKFRFDRADELQKHAHLNFYTSDKQSVLSFVDYRRFGRWEVNSDWGAERGPCVILEYEKFRENVLSNLQSAAFNKPICETLLNQKYFNGIGNYLRAEILYRLKIPPFTRARDVLEPLAQENRVKSETRDILELCNILPTEVTNLSGGAGYDPEADEKDHSEFAGWLQCYYNPDMKNMVDNNRRTIWFSGPAGPMVPKENKTRARKSKTNLNKKKSSAEEPAPEKKLTRKALSKKKPKLEPEIKEEPIETKSKLKIKEECNENTKPAKRKAVKQEITGDKDLMQSKKIKMELQTNGYENETRKGKEKQGVNTRARRSQRLSSKDLDTRVQVS